MLSPYFSPATALLGGVAVGSATAAHALIFGRVTGVSGHLSRVFTRRRLSDIFLLIGLFVAGLFAPSPPNILVFAIPRIALAGMLVAIGSSAAGGCTSGHAVCGLARCSRRSLVAVPMFMFTAAVTVHFGNTTAALAQADAFNWPVRFASDLSSGLVYISLTVSAIGFLAFAAHEASVRSREYISYALQTLVGFCFGIGLLVSQMAYPYKVVSFFAFKSNFWDPSLMFVFPGALLISSGAFYYVLKRGTSPVMIPKTHSLPSSTFIDGKLVCGSTMFGVGWGLLGLCPGPAVTLLGSTISRAFWFSSTKDLASVLVWFLGYGAGLVMYEELLSRI